jgi:hypothetical protein
VGGLEGLVWERAREEGRDVASNVDMQVGWED